MPEGLAFGGSKQQFAATFSFAALAADFVTEPEVWPVFLAWVKANSDDGRAFSSDNIADFMPLVGRMSFMAKQLNEQ